MARQLRFTTYTSSEDLEPIEVWIGPENDPKKQEMFLFRPMVAGTDVMDMLAGISSENSAEVAKSTGKLLKLAVTPKDEDRFFEFISDPDNFVGPTKLEDIAIGLAEVYMNLPTESEQRSSNGSAPSGSGQGAAPSKAKGRTSRNSTPAS